MTQVEFQEFVDYETFRETFGGAQVPQIELFRRAGIRIEHLSLDGLIELVHLLYNLWPHTRNKYDLIHGVKRAVQTRFYVQIYGREPSQQMLKRDEKSRELLALSEEPAEETKQAKKTTKKKKAGVMETKEEGKQSEPQNSPAVTPTPAPSVPVVQAATPEATGTPVTPTETPKVKKEKTEFSIKVSAMSLEDLIKWAQELGVEQAKIDRHKDKPLGLAKMNISNMVRARLEKKA